jgi:3-isopropylmalate/(R)-2-methylmalate dehydratase small subunit
MSDLRVERIEGRALPLRGQDIDTDRIIPARFLVSVTFEGLERHVFEDDRKALAGRTPPHAFDNPAYQGARVLIVNRNFGCGSSREHAPQALIRWGIQAVVGESFSEIFSGNATALGMPCLTVSSEDAERLLTRAEQSPRDRFTVDVRELTVTAGDLRVTASMPSAAQTAFLDGVWDATALLLEKFDDVNAVAARLPYVRGF